MRAASETVYSGISKRSVSVVVRVVLLVRCIQPGWWDMVTALPALGHVRPVTSGRRLIGWKSLGVARSHRRPFAAGGQKETTREEH